MEHPLNFQELRASSPIPFLLGQRETEFRSLIHRSGCPDSSTVPGDNPLHGRQSYTGSGKIRLRMEALEWTEQPVRIRGVKSCAVVPDEKDCLFTFIPATELDPRRILSRGVFPGIAKQVLQDYGDQAFIGESHTTVGNDRFNLPFTALRQVVEDRSCQSAHVHRNMFGAECWPPERDSTGRRSSEDILSVVANKIVEQMLCSGDSPSAGLQLQQERDIRDLLQWSAEVMRHGVRKSFQLPVRRGKLRRPFRNFLLKDRPALLDFVEHFVEGLDEKCHFVTGAEGSRRERSSLFFAIQHARVSARFSSGRMIDPRIAQVASRAIAKQTSKIPADSTPNCPAL